LTLSESIWGTIRAALETSRTFVLMASPAAARSAWVSREVMYWQANRKRSTFFIVLTDGNILRIIHGG
jgi:hypothetical protein